MGDKLSFEDLKSLLKCGATQDECLFCNEEDVLIRGSVREQTFKLPFESNLIKKLAIVYSQDNKVAIKKSLDDITVSSFDKSLIYFRLNEYETYKLKSDFPVKVQMKVLLEDGSILISEIFEVKVADTLDDSLFASNIMQYIALDINIKNQEVEVVENLDLYAGGELTYICKFNFDSSWDGFNKVIYFKNEYNYKSVPINLGSLNGIGDSCAIPPKAVEKPGLLYVSVVGESEYVTKPTEWSCGIKVKKSCNESIENAQSGGSGDTVPYATETVAGIMKLYKGAGDHEDGTVTQKAITKGFNSIKFDVAVEDKECMILGVDF